MNNCLILTRLDNHTALVRMNRPEAHNAYNQEMVNAFDKTIDLLEKDPSISFVILTGNGTQSFCSGADLKEAVIDKGVSLLSDRGGYQPLQYRSRKKIWVAAVNGFAYGGGFELALHCDFIIACHEAKFALPEVKYGLLPLGGGLQKLNAIIPKVMLKEIVLGSRIISASEALTLGIIDKVTSQDCLMEATIEFTNVLREKPLQALLAANDLINSLDLLSTPDWNKLRDQYLRELN